jgi:Arc/MetJ-type ribon-helix-helix transcriptional regulator
MTHKERITSMAIKLNLQPQIEREMEELVPLSGARSRTEYINIAVREKNERLRRDQQIAALRRYFTGHRAELRSINCELRNAARDTDED